MGCRLEDFLVRRRGGSAGPGWGPASNVGNGGSLFVGESGYVVTGAYGEGTRVLSREELAKYPFKAARREPATPHYMDWIRAAKDGGRAASDFSISGPFTEWVLLGALAARVSGKLDWDSPACASATRLKRTVCSGPQFAREEEELAI